MMSPVVLESTSSTCEVPSVKLHIWGWEGGSPRSSLVHTEVTRQAWGGAESWGPKTPEVMFVGFRRLMHQWSKGEREFGGSAVDVLTSPPFSPL
ncbi:unnamed protein product [Pleuronectes platessa]|uniref:Uncharacterized protein n=1 Tax=Pleuronectes platessa TaxID=8262 RepID=A0A9N7UZP1_PLEPL|nr:unnamed protein product [Pleuronectes platessa]